MEIKSGPRPVTWRRTLLFLAVLAAFCAIWLVYNLGEVNGVAGLAELRQEYGGLEQRHHEISSENEDLRKQVAILERATQIDRQAIQGVKSEFSEHQEELLALREEIEFYRGIVSPDKVKPGLRVYRFDVFAGEQPGEYRFDLVLTQFKHNDRYIRGAVHWEIAGRQGETAQVLTLADVSSDASSVLNFKFRYFQHLTGDIRLPEEFAVDTVLLRVKSAAKGNPIVEYTLKWPAEKELRQGE